MREILFRGKRVDTGEWVEGFFVSVLPVDTPHPKQKAVIFPAEARCNWFNKYFYSAVEVIPETVGQYTGLTDKNGTKIFEGDIVDILTENEEIGVVDYEDGGFLVNADGFSVDFHANIYGTDLEVIGNIHDHHLFRLEEAK